MTGPDCSTKAAIAELTQVRPADPDHCAACSCIAFIDKTKKASSDIHCSDYMPYSHATKTAYIRQLVMILISLQNLI